MSTSNILREKVAEIKALNYDVVEIQIGEERLAELRSEFSSLSGFSSVLSATPRTVSREDKFMGIPVKTRAELRSEIIFIVEHHRPHLWADDCLRATPRHKEQPQKKFCPYCGEALI